MQKNLVFFIFLFVTVRIMAQEPIERKTLIMGVPQYLIKNAVRIDYDRKVAEGRWLSFAPIIYLKEGDATIENSNYYNDYSYNQNSAQSIVSLTGAGLGISQKHDLNIIHSRPYDFQFYFSYGVSYTYYDIKLIDNIMTPFTDKDGIIFQRYAPDEFKMNIQKLGADFTIGTRREINENFMIDLFVGFGMRYSFHNTPNIAANSNNYRFSESIIDYGYTGTLLVGGIRIGLAL